MKNIITSSLILVCLLIGTTAHAAIVAQTTPVKTTFDVQVADVTRSLKTDDVRFDLKVESIVNPQYVAYWKIRTMCDGGMTIQLTASSSSSCGKAVKVNSFEKNMFSFIFTNDTDVLKKFSVKVKAYDINGKWMYTDTESFRWK